MHYLYYINRLRTTKVDSTLNVIADWTVLFKIITGTPYYVYNANAINNYDK